MRIASVELRREDVPLTRPYTIAYKTTSAVEMLFVRLVTDDGRTGCGAASPAPAVTGETVDACAEALEVGARHLERRQVEDLAGTLATLSARLDRTPAALAAFDIALHDLQARAAGAPLVETLGRCHHSLPTSVTVGILGVEETLAEAREHLGNGFRALKIKLGRSIDEDEARLRRLREELGRGFALRVDANQGYRGSDLARIAGWIGRLELELVEQPLPVGEEAILARAPRRLRSRVALDETIRRPADARAIADGPPCCGIFNIKLMKCGGIAPALEIAEIARRSRLALMWGCMDESVIGIAAALHAAFACPSTRFIDLDGSLDLARDPGRGGFVLRGGRMQTTDVPGHGATFSE